MAAPTRYDPRRVDTQLHIVSVTDENGDPVYWETYDDATASSACTSTTTPSSTAARPTSSSTRSRTSPGIFDDTGDDEFYWDVNGTDWAQPFGTVSATVHLGDGLASALTGDVACYRGELGLGHDLPDRVIGRHRHG